MSVSPPSFAYSSDLPVPDPDSAGYKYQQGSVSESMFMLPTIETQQCSRDLHTHMSRLLTIDIELIFV